METLTGESTTKRAITASTCNHGALRRAARGVAQLYDQTLAPSGLNATQYNLLSAIERLKKPTQSELAADLVMDLSALGHTLKPLIRDGLVGTRPDELDGRKRRVILTRAGMARRHAAEALWRSAQRRFEAVHGRKESAALRRLLDVLASTSFI